MDARYKYQRATLSKRAQEVSHPDRFASRVWDNVRNQWHPDTNPDGVFSLGIAENTLMHKELANFINRTTNVSPFAFTYGDGPHGTVRLRKAVARILNRKVNPAVPLEHDHVMITNGTSHSIEHVAWCFADEGDGFLLGQPYYGSFLQDIEMRPNVKVVKVTFGDIDPMSPAAVQEYERALLSAAEQGTKIRGLMLCNPHNPLGRCFSRETLIAYMRLCQKYQIHLVSDEIYMFSTWNNAHDNSPPHLDFTSALSIPLDGIIDPALVHVLWGMSKDFGANGLRVGYLISQHNAPFRRTCLDLGLYAYASQVSEHIAANILEDDAWVDNYMQENQRRLANSYSFVIRFLKQHQIPYATGANAAFFIWADLGKAYLDRHPQEPDTEITSRVFNLLVENKVWLASGFDFGSEKPGIFRIVFSHPVSFLERALANVAAAIGADSGIDKAPKPKL